MAAATNGRASNLDGLLHSMHRQKVLQQEHQYLSKKTNVEVFEVGRTTSQRQKMDDTAFCSYAKVAKMRSTTFDGEAHRTQENQSLLSEDVQFLVMYGWHCSHTHERRLKAFRFVPDKQHDTDKLQLSPNAFELLLDRFEICSRFAGLVHMQMQPSRKLAYDTITGKLSRIEYIYSHIVRSLSAAANPKDPTKRVLDWRRFCVWTGRNMLTGETTIVALRCPFQVQERLMSYGDDPAWRQQLLRHPMLVHASLAEQLIIMDSYFSKEFAAPIYGLVSCSSNPSPFIHCICYESSHSCTHVIVFEIADIDK